MTIMKWILIFCAPYTQYDCESFMKACYNPDLLGTYNNVKMEIRTEESMFDSCMLDFLYNIDPFLFDLKRRKCR